MKKPSMTKYSWNKGQLNVDLIISYLLFIFFLIFLFQFIINLTNPFNNAMTYTREKQVMELLRENMPSRINQRGVYESCLFYQEDVESIRTEFKIMGFPMPEKDISPLIPNQTTGSLVFSRERDKLKISAGTEQNPKNISVIIVFPENMNPSFIENTTETNDQIQTYSDSFGNTVAEIIFRINSSDSDQVNAIIMERGMVFLEEFSGIDQENIYIGNTPLQMSCGVNKGGYSSVLEGYTVFTKDQKIFPVKYKFNVWWLR